MGRPRLNARYETVGLTSLWKWNQRVHAIIALRERVAYIPGHRLLTTIYTYKARSLDHLVDQLGHVLLPVSGITTLDVTSELSRPPSTSGVGELEWPEVGGSLLEVRSASSDLVNQVLHTCLLVCV